VGAALDARRPVSAWNHVRAIALLPVMNVIIVPALILAWMQHAALPWTNGAAAGIAVAAIALLVLVGGLTLAAHSIALFVLRGDGTLAPWDPAQRLIMAGAYRYCRNPLKAGLFLILLGECLLLGSPALAWWAGAFILANLLYIRLAEEPGLRARFGKSYEHYCATVPRWWPRLRTPNMAADAAELP
jgi:protein-S-isoprenylcysteine O-methyltransferase Ste14